MRKFRLSRILGVAGLAMALSVMSVWWYINTFNTFHLPTVEQASLLTSYAPPSLYIFFQHLVLILVPGMWLGIFTEDLSRSVNDAVWVFAVLLDGVIFYSVGAILDKLRAHQSKN